MGNTSLWMVVLESSSNDNDKTRYRDLHEKTRICLGGYRHATNINSVEHGMGV